MYIYNKVKSIFFQQFLQKIVEVLVKALHKVRVNDNGIVINNVEFGDVFLVLILENERIGSYYRHVLHELFLPLSCFATTS